MFGYTFIVECHGEMGRIDIVTNVAIILLFRLLIEPSRSRNIGDVY